MAKLQRTSRENFDTLLSRIEQGILEGSLSASLEERCDFSEGSARCSVRVFERYSALGSNRVSLSVTLFQSADGPVRICGISSGGSQAMLFKLNTLGEEAFLEKLEALL